MTDSNVTNRFFYYIPARTKFIYDRPKQNNNNMQQKQQQMDA